MCKSLTQTYSMYKNRSKHYEIRRKSAAEFPTVFVCLFGFDYHWFCIYYFLLLLSEALLYAVKDEIQGLIQVKKLT